METAHVFPGNLLYAMGTLYLGFFRPNLLFYRPGSLFHCDRLAVEGVLSIAAFRQSEFHETQNRSFPMERMLLISAFDSNETGNRADRTGNSPISKFQTQHAYMPSQTTGKKHA